MKIWVEHEVSDHPYSCLYSDGTFMEGQTVCKYHKFLTQTHGRKRPPDRNKPKCVLFDTWLEAPYNKCSACKELIKVVTNDGNFCGHCGAKMDGGVVYD